MGHGEAGGGVSELCVQRRKSSARHCLVDRTPTTTKTCKKKKNVKTQNVASCKFTHLLLFVLLSLRIDAAAALKRSCSSWLMGLAPSAESRVPLLTAPTVSMADDTQTPLMTARTKIPTLMPAWEMVEMLITAAARHARRHRFPLPAPALRIHASI